MSKAQDMDITLIGDEELTRVLRNLDYKTQHKVLKRIVNDASQKTIAKELKAKAPNRSGRLKASMGTKAGKSKRSAVSFVGPRVPGGSKDKITNTNQGYIANVIEFNKGQKRYPGFDKKKGEIRKRPKAPWGVRLHSGVMPTTKKGFIKRAVESQMKPAEMHIIKSLRTIMVREMNKARKKGIV
jgi:hypothetical protein